LQSAGAVSAGPELGAVALWLSFRAQDSVGQVGQATGVGLPVLDRVGQQSQAATLELRLGVGVLGQ